MIRDIFGPKWLFIQFQKLRLGGEIPRVVLVSPETECWDVHETLCAVCVIAVNE